MQQLFLYHFVPTSVHFPTVRQHTRIETIRHFSGKMARRLSLLLVFNLLFEETLFLNMFNYGTTSPCKSDTLTHRNLAKRKYKKSLYETP